MVLSSNFRLVSVITVNLNDQCGLVNKVIVDITVVSIYLHNDFITRGDIIKGIHQRNYGLI